MKTKIEIEDLQHLERLLNDPDGHHKVLKAKLYYMEVFPYFASAGKNERIAIPAEIAVCQFSLDHGISKTPTSCSTIPLDSPIMNAEHVKEAEDRRYNIMTCGHGIPWDQEKLDERAKALMGLNSDYARIVNRIHKKAGRNSMILVKAGEMENIKACWTWLNEKYKRMKQRYSGTLNPARLVSAEAFLHTLGHWNLNGGISAGLGRHGTETEKQCSFHKELACPACALYTAATFIERNIIGTLKAMCCKELPSSHDIVHFESGDPRTSASPCSLGLEGMENGQKGEVQVRTMETSKDSGTRDPLEFVPKEHPGESESYVSLDDDEPDVIVLEEEDAFADTQTFGLYPTQMGKEGPVEEEAVAVGATISVPWPWDEAKGEATEEESKEETVGVTEMWSEKGDPGNVSGAAGASVQERDVQDGGRISHGIIGLTVTWAKDLPVQQRGLGRGIKLSFQE